MFPLFWQVARRVIPCGERPLVMGIVNVTPDSFSDGGSFLDREHAVEHALELEAEGADLIDVGGESTRPGALLVSAEEEWRRVGPVLEKLSGRVTVPLSIDTTKAEVARRALACGVEIINDVSGGEWDEDLWSVVAESGAGYVLMHSQGRPETMQMNPTYDDVIVEVREYLLERLLRASAMGISVERVVCDVGFGFGKTLEHNLALLTRLSEFRALGRPLLVGMSRKSFVKKIGGEAQIPLCTELVHLWSAARGAAIWRVHDVKAAVATARMAELLRRAGPDDL